MIEIEKPPMWFWVVAGLALLWNLVGVYAYLGEVGALGPANRTQFAATMPGWVTAAFAIGVWGGVLGSIALLLRARWARLVLLISLIGSIADWGWVFTRGGAGISPIGVAVIVIGVLLVWFAGHAAKRGWLR